LCGEAHKINLLEAMAPQFSSAEVEYIKAPLLDLGEFEATIGDTISEYAIPIMTAWGVADSKTDGLYGVNIISRYIIESQRNLALAWHGVLIAAMVSLSIAFFILQIPARMNTIKHAKEELAVQQQKLHELDVFRAKRDQLNSDITRYNNAITVYDNVAPGSDRWSRILHYLANSVEDLNGIWINSIQPDPSNSRGILITGRTLFRGRIPRIASIFEKATLKEVRLVEIRKKTLYEFDIVVEQVDKNDVAEVNSGK
jgi:Tfp pilus assembly protein PilN